MLYLTIIGAVFVAWLILVLLFTPHVPYHIDGPIDATSDHFVHVLESRRERSPWEKVISTVAWILERQQ